MPLTVNTNAHQSLTGITNQVNSSNHSRVSNSQEAIQSCSYGGLWAASGGAVGMLLGGVIGLALATYGTFDQSHEEAHRDTILVTMSSIIGVAAGGVSGFMAERLCSSILRQNNDERDAQELHPLDVRNDDVLPTASNLLSNFPPNYEDLPLPPAYTDLYCESSSGGELPPAYDTLSVHAFSWFQTAPELPAYESLSLDLNNTSRNNEE